MMLSSISLTFENFAVAVPGAANFLSNYYVPFVPLPGGYNVTLDTEDEVRLSGEVADYISSILGSTYTLFDLRNSSCTVSSSLSVIEDLSNYDTGVIYSKGHRHAINCATCGNQQTGLIMYDDTLWDYAIYPKTSSSKIVHAFLWHCETAIKPGSSTCVGGCAGLPGAVMHDPNIIKWSSYGDKVYLGWTNAVPGYPYPLPGGSPQYTWEVYPYNYFIYSYAHIASSYYYYVGLAVSCHGYPTTDALISLSYDIYGTSFENSPLGKRDYPSDPSWLEVYGNMYLGLPSI